MERFLEKKYHDEVKKNLMKKFNYSSIMQVPRIEKIVINMTTGGDTADSKAVLQVENELMQITGQKPLRTFARKSLASFKLREGMPIGAKVTLRREKMWDFLTKLIHIALPRVRDFQGLKTTSFDQFGNYAMGVTEQIIFPEIEFHKIQKIRGFDVIIVTSAKTKEESLALLEGIGLPFKKKGKK